MKVCEILLLEMATRVYNLNVGDKIVGIQIRTKSPMAGQSEHPPPHIHVLYRGKIDIPISLETYEILNKKHNVDGKLSKEEMQYVIEFIEFCGKKELIDIFNLAQKGKDPEPYFKNLWAKREAEWKKGNESSKNYKINNTKR
jgi:hypothetical protein